MSRPTLARRLRHETRDAHVALESVLPIAKREVSIADYRDHLRFLLSVHDPLESRLRRVPSLDRALPDLTQRFKTDKLRRDLGGASDGPRPGDGLLPEPQTAVQALGVLYVLEGATLGARTLVPALGTRGVIPGPVGTTYLRGYGARTSVMWKRLGDALDHVPPSRADEVVSWARTMFASLLAWRRQWDAR